MKKGIFIDIEGCEGSGKSTQIELLRARYPDIVCTREPGGSDYGEEIRKVILSSKFAKQADALTHLCLFFASRRDHMRNIVMPALKAGKTVVSDRLDASSFAYQLYGLGGSDLRELFFMLRDKAFEGFVPDLYVIFDVDPEEGMRRVKKRYEAKGDFNHFDDRGIDFHARVREGYLEFAKAFPDQVRVIDGNLSVEEVWRSFEGAIRPILGK